MPAWNGRRRRNRSRTDPGACPDASLGRQGRAGVARGKECARSPEARRRENHRRHGPDAARTRRQPGAHRVRDAAGTSRQVRARRRIPGGGCGPDVLRLQRRGVDPDSPAARGARRPGHGPQGAWRTGCAAARGSAGPLCAGTRRAGRRELRPVLPPAAPAAPGSGNRRAAAARRCATRAAGWPAPAAAAGAACLPAGGGCRDQGGRGRHGPAPRAHRHGEAGFRATGAGTLCRITRVSADVLVRRHGRSAAGARRRARRQG